MNRPPPALRDDLEIWIDAPRAGEGDRRVRFVYSGERPLPAEGRLPAALLADWAEASAADMGRALFAALAGGAGGELDLALRAALAGSEELAVRLALDPADAAVAALPWELLSPSPDGTPRAAATFLGAAVATPFSRFVQPESPWRSSPVFARPIRLLVAVASPAGLPDGYPALDPAAERDALAQALAAEVSAEAAAEAAAGGQPPPFAIVPWPADRPVTLDGLIEALRADIHILHLVAHGHPGEAGETALLLADADGQAIPVAPAELASHLARLSSPALRLLSLASCLTAAAETPSLAGFAPQLIRRAGVPAVVAMRGKVLVETARAFAATFYRELAGSGRVDLAANAARAELCRQERGDFAAPVLYHRLPSGRLFQRYGEVIGQDGELFWETLLDDLQGSASRGSFCLPILGPELTRGLLPLPAETARALAKTWPGYPFPDPGDLPRVAQVVAANDRGRAGRLVLAQWQAALRRSFPEARVEVDDDLAPLTPRLAACDWTREVCRRSEVELHHLLAELPFDLYLTTNGDPFLWLALGGDARASRQVLAWRDGPRRAAGEPGASPGLDLAPRPSREHPVACHLFGTDEAAESLVISEDDHLAFLSQVSYDFEARVPITVQRALAERSLLFLGYPPDDLGLKVLLQGLLAHVHHEQYDKQKVAVQIDPQAIERDEAAAIREYLKGALHRQGDVKIYWGTTRQFIEELAARQRARVARQAKEAAGG